MKRYIIAGACLLLACAQSINAQLFKSNPLQVSATIGNVYTKTEVDTIVSTNYVPTATVNATNWVATVVAETNRAQIAESVNATNWVATVVVVSNRVTSLESWKGTGVSTVFTNNYAVTNVTFTSFGIVTNNTPTP